MCTKKLIDGVIYTTPCKAACEMELTALIIEKIELEKAKNELEPLDYKECMENINHRIDRSILFLMLDNALYMADDIPRYVYNRFSVDADTDDLALVFSYDEVYGGF